ncbi:hydroxymethylbilane synthase [Candidatus Deianiraea vastatrix]|uniref:Hydroxymethylbilane synthase n=1 Tax=Candidatus Deianiraea vastatrix TaxID=2163644 RepID=A0A5B8XCJ6_9RICK|nr:hydroxymethylbilane synthase [Candidatus Deianiraea vastatrix]QED23079.1 Porphobilinogen deaminase [Candidatus Deianiraea vastatrix]
MLKIRVGTRDSMLAIKQAKIVIKKISKISKGAFKFEIVKIKTIGDKNNEEIISDKGGFKGVFTKEIQDAMQRNEIDIAIHSMKDLQVNMPDGSEVVSILPRDPSNDGFFSDKWPSISKLPHNAKIGTSSLRRKMFLQKIRPDIEIIPIRGNINTRFEKMKNMDLDGIILSYCGPKRLKMLKKSRFSEKIDISIMTPSPGQGAIGIEMLSSNTNDLLRSILQKISCKKTFFEVKKERMLARLACVFCQMPFACNVKKYGEFVELRVNFENDKLGKNIAFNEKMGINTLDAKIEDIAKLISEI